ncbi:MAG: menaquinone biosynthesis protein [Selenomonadaceae bacterium]|nr:menaquinone biosynthesis protein [Selenomonadaceae bacterium]
MNSPRIGHIDFLNVLPFGYGYAHFSDDLQIIRGVPTFLNSELNANRVDISNISSIEYARHSDKLLILPKICVRADNAVTSIVLISRKPIEDITDDKIILTSKSATAQRLLKIILHDGYDAAPQYETRSVTIDNPVAKDATAALLIGDDALYVYLHRPENFYLYDLGCEWHKLTGRQMVYALWAVRKDFAVREPENFRAVYQKILRAFNYGLEHKADAINSVLTVKPFTFAELDKYLGGAIKWDLTAESLDALKIYYQRAAALHLIDCEPELEFADV